MRSHGHQITPNVERIVAESGLRICLADQARIDESAALATALIEAIEV